MSKQTPPRKPVPTFRPPPAFKGMPCYWYGDPADAPMGALVADVGQQVITVSIVVPGTSNFLTRDGVRHASDPACARPEARANGTWDYSPVFPRETALERAPVAPPPEDKPS